MKINKIITQISLKYKKLSLYLKNDQKLKSSKTKPHILTRL